MQNIDREYPERGMEDRPEEGDLSRLTMITRDRRRRPIELPGIPDEPTVLERRKGQQTDAPQEGKDNPKEQTTLAERHPDWPNVSVRFYFSAHGTNDDFVGIDDALEDADVYLFEGYRGDYDSAIRKMQHVADGDLSGSSSIDTYILEIGEKGRTRESVMRAFHKHQRPVVVGHIDLRETDETEHELANRIDWSFRRYVTEDFRATLDNYKKSLHDRVSSQHEREAVILKRFEEEMETIVRNPRLRGKDDLVVVVSMGAAHRSLQELFEQHGITTERVDAYNVNDYDLDLWRKIQEGEELDDLSLARGYFFEQMLRRQPSYRQAHTEKARYASSLVSEFTLEEIALYHQNPTAENLNEMLSLKGLPTVPTKPDLFRQWILDSFRSF